MRFNVDFYNEAHRDALLGSPISARVQELASTGLVVDDEVFVTHSVFTDQMDAPGYRTFKELRERLPPRRADFQEYFQWDHGSLAARYSPADTQNHRIERAGVAAALLTANQLLDLTEADWQKIRVGRKTSNDFTSPDPFAATNDRYVEIEAKASITDDPSRRTPTISNHRASIEEKKSTQRESGNRNLMLGVITAIPNSIDQDATALLLDPPASSFKMPPTTHRLVGKPGEEHRPRLNRHA